MPDLSVIIPARKETWLLQTVTTIRAAIRGDTEIIVVLDGEEDEPRLPAVWPEDGGPRVRILRNETPHGQRQAINQAARGSEAKFLLKTDAHSFLEAGFDLKLMADCQSDWTVLPRMWNLHSHDMVCRHCGSRFYNRPAMLRCESCLSETVSGKPAMIRRLRWRRNKKKPPTDFMWFRSPYAADMPLRIAYWDATAAREFPVEYAAFRSWAKEQPEIADVMTGQGACWFLHRQRFWDLGGLDESHGHWGQMGVEIACKTWLSGGRHVVNRKTWFAHLFRCGGSEGCPWPMDGRQQEAARQYSIDLWSHNKWPGQIRPLEWLVDKFWPVPTWRQPDRAQIQAFPTSRSPITKPPERIAEEVKIEQLAQERAAELIGRVDRTDPSDRTDPTDHDLTVLYYTDVSLPHEFALAVLGQLQAAAGGLPVVKQHQPGDWPRSHESIYRNILAGLDRVTTPYVALAEHDVLYPEGYFDHRPTHDVEYNMNRWRLHVDREIFCHKRGCALSQLIARTAALKRNIAERLRHPETYQPHSKCFEPGRLDKISGLGLTPITVGYYNSIHPTVDILHGGNFTGAIKFPRGRRRPALKDWGTAREVIERFHVPKILQSAAEAKTTETAEPANPQSTVDHRDAPIVSVLIPARNEKFLEATVRDLLQKLRLPFEILVGLDGPDQQINVGAMCPGVLFDDPRDHGVRIIRTETRIGMRPMINRLARAARGKYLIRMDAHCMIDEGMDAKLVEVCAREGHVGVVAMRYELDAKRWQRRDKTDIPYRRLSHDSEDGCGLRSLPWPEYAESHKAEVIGETMSCSGSSWTCRRDTFVDWWGGFDEGHGTFGQEGCEIACMFWLSGGRFLVHKGTWYAHHNRGKATYALGAHVKSQSIARSRQLWLGNQWPHARYGFDWLIRKFSPPGWPAPKLPAAFPGPKQLSLCKTTKRLRVDELWERRDAIADPGKLYRLQIFWAAYDEFVHDILADKPWDRVVGRDGNWPWNGQYAHYLLGHVTRDPSHQSTPKDWAKVYKSLRDSVKLIQSVKKEGLRAPLEFYQDQGNLILWKGYRRLVIARAVGIPRVVGRVFADRRAAGAMSPQLNLTRLQNPPVADLHRMAEARFAQYGFEGGSDKYHTHNYTRYYDVHLHQIRKRAKKVLELGLLKGASLVLWREYFPRAELYGVDIDPERWRKFAGALDRCHVMIGDETDAAFMAGVAKQGPFDLIVDDGSHDPAVQRVAFTALWASVRQYGYYVMEDTFRGYDEEGKKKGPGLPPGFESRLYQQRDVLALHHYYNIVFVQKA